MIIKNTIITDNLANFIYEDGFSCKLKNVVIIPTSPFIILEPNNQEIG